VSAHPIKAVLLLGVLQSPLFLRPLSPRPLLLQQQQQNTAPSVFEKAKPLSLSFRPVWILPSSTENTANST
jgi:hypothetical protein